MPVVTGIEVQTVPGLSAFFLAVATSIWPCGFVSEALMLYGFGLRPVDALLQLTISEIQPVVLLPFQMSTLLRRTF